MTECGQPCFKFSFILCFLTIPFSWLHISVLQTWYRIILDLRTLIWNLYGFFALNWVFSETAGPGLSSLPAALLLLLMVWGSLVADITGAGEAPCCRELSHFSSKPHPWMGGLTWDSTYTRGYLSPFKGFGQGKAEKPGFLCPSVDVSLPTGA